MTEDIKRKINEALALAQGWKATPNYCAPGLLEVPGGGRLDYPPDYFRDDAEAHKAKFELAEWLDASDERIQQQGGATYKQFDDFEKALQVVINDGLDGLELSVWYGLTATPAQVATAAAVALGIITESEAGLVPVEVEK